MPKYLTDVEIEEAFQKKYIPTTGLNLPDPFSNVKHKPKENSCERFFSQHPTDEAVEEAFARKFIPV